MIWHSSIPWRVSSASYAKQLTDRWIEFSGGLVPGHKKVQWADVIHPRDTGYILATRGMAEGVSLQYEDVSSLAIKEI